MLGVSLAVWGPDEPVGGACGGSRRSVRGFADSGASCPRLRARPRGGGHRAASGRERVRPEQTEAGIGRSLLSGGPDGDAGGMNVHLSCVTAVKDRGGDCGRPRCHHAVLP